MHSTRFFKVLYYLNTTLFSFLLIYILLSLIFMVLALFNIMGIEITFSASISTFNIFDKFIGICLITLGLYKSFLPLNDLKKGRFSAISWKEQFKTSGILFCISSLMFLMDIHEFANKNENIHAFFVWREPNFYIDLNYSSLMLFGIGVLLIFISRLRPDLSK